MLPFIVLSTVVGATLIGAAFFVLTYQKEELVANIQQADVQVASLRATPLDKNNSEALLVEDKKPQEKAQEINETAIAQNSVEAKENTQSIQEIKKEPEIQEEIKRVVLTPSLEFISKIDTTAPKNHSLEVISNKKKEVVVAEEIKPVIQEIKVEKIEPIKMEEPEIPIAKEEKKGSISISRRDEQKDIADVIKRFNVNHNPALSLFVAKKYYQLGDYEQAYNYALATNDINKNIEESWILFAKSLVKLNKKEMAVETLKKYISHSNSPQAKQLLEEIKVGKFQ
ncbi:MAG: CDC27 family protein [Sulfurimonas sp.]|nr:CDC27 family protein [Sulfurimonas sp.]